MKYAQDVTKYKAKSGLTQIHIMHQDDERTLCHRLTRHRIVNGIKVKLLYDVKGPATCKGCITGLEIIAREMLHGLTGQQLTEIVDILRKMRNGDSP